MQQPEGITQLLVDWSKGDQKALDKLMPLVYSELRRQAGNYLRRERQGHTLQPTVPHSAGSGPSEANARKTFSVRRDTALS